MPPSLAATPEHRRLHATITSQAARIRELEETIARCMARGIRYREVMHYPDDKEDP